MEATKPFLISFAKVSIISEIRKLFNVFLYYFKLYFLLETHFKNFTFLHYSACNVPNKPFLNKIL